MNWHHSQKSSRLLIIGGLAAGMSAAAEARRVDPVQEITVIERSQLVNWAKCSLPFHVAGKSVPPEKTPRYTADYFRKERNIDLRLASEVLEIDLAGHSVLVRDNQRGGEYQLSFDKLILALGTKPRLPFGWNDFTAPKNVCTVHGITDSTKIDQLITDPNVTRAVIMGGGVLGLEMAWALRQRGISVVLVEKQSQFPAGLSPDGQDLIRQILEINHIQLITGFGEIEPVQAVDQLVGLRIDGVFLALDLLVSAIGFVPDTELAATAGIKVGSTGGIQVNQKLQTSEHKIWACGDCAEFRHQVNRKPTLNRVAPSAIRSGYVAGSNAAGRFRQMPGICNPFLARVFSVHVGGTGLNLQEAQEYLGHDFQLLQHRSLDLPAYLHEQSGPLLLDVYCSKRTGHVVGAAMLGRHDLKRLDLLTLLIQERIPLDRLAEMDFLYTPDYCTAMDPLYLLAGRRQSEIN